MLDYPASGMDREPSANSPTRFVSQASARVSVAADGLELGEASRTDAIWEHFFGLSYFVLLWGISHSVSPRFVEDRSIQESPCIYVRMTPFAGFCPMFAGIPAVQTLGF